MAQCGEIEREHEENAPAAPPYSQILVVFKYVVMLWLVNVCVCVIFKPIIKVIDDKRTLINEKIGWS
jgi:F0F1-type ATP synthase membrane subunit b/b'